MIDVKIILYTGNLILNINSYEDRKNTILIFYDEYKRKEVKFMGKILVLAEKPSVGRDIAKVLNCNINKRSYLEGNKYIVTWALGHLVTLADPEVYDEKYKKWSMETLPMLPTKIKLVVIDKTAKHFSEVKKVMNRSDIDELIIATDPAREGELVGRWIIEKVGFHKPIKRL